MKKVIKFIAIAIISVGILFGGVFLYVYFKNNKTYKSNQNNIEALNDTKTKFPITDYVYFPQELNTQEEKTNTQDLQKIFKNEDENKKQAQTREDPLKKELEETKNFTNPNKITPSTPYTEKIFSNAEDEFKKLREQILSLRSTPLNIKTKQNLNQDREISFDFGDNRFTNQESKDIATSETKLFRTITANKKIPAILIDAISSDLSGKIVAQVEDNIYASMGNAVLIPKGSQAIGFYDNNNKIGVNRLQVVWSEIITPQGINILLTDASNADVVGKSGILGKINNKYWERYGLALSLSTLANALTLTIANQTAKFPNYQTQQVLSQGGQDISSIMQNIIQEQIKINPTVEISAGSRIFINPSTHMWFPEPKEGEILVKYFNNIKEIKREKE